MAKIDGSKPVVNLSQKKGAHTHLILANSDGFKPDAKATKVVDQDQGHKFAIKKQGLIGTKLLWLKIKLDSKGGTKGKDATPTLTVTVTATGMPPTPVPIPVNYVTDDMPCD